MCLKLKSLFSIICMLSYLIRGKEKINNKIIDRFLSKDVSVLLIILFDLLHLSNLNIKGNLIKKFINSQSIEFQIEA